MTLEISTSPTSAFRVAALPSTYTPRTTSVDTVSSRKML
jgi:hypothetical protein